MPSKNIEKIDKTKKNSNIIFSDFFMSNYFNDFSV